MSIDYIIKVTTVGDQGVGKTCIINRFTTKRFSDYYDITIGVDFSAKNIQIESPGGGRKNIKVQVWDTAGQERFRSITRSYYKNSAVVLMIFDVSSSKSFYHIDKWLQEVRNTNVKNHPILYLIGNKTDVHNREVHFSVAEKYAKDNNMIYVETSAKQDNKGIDTLFYDICNRVIDNIKKGISIPGQDNGIKLLTNGQGYHHEPTRPDFKDCCDIS